MSIGNHPIASLRELAGFGEASVKRVVICRIGGETVVRIELIAKLNMLQVKLDGVREDVGLDYYLKGIACKYLIRCGKGEDEYVRQGIRHHGKGILNLRLKDTALASAITR